MSTWVCIGSGPSLTQADCDLVSGMPTIVVNDSWKMAPGLLYAGDLAWWDKHHASVNREARKCYTRSATAANKYKIELFVGIPGKYNSGQKAIELAAHLGATSILTIGYDCSIARGIHWHGRHEAGLRNPGAPSVVSWHGEFLEMCHKVKLPPVINCSRYTELACFPKMTLEDALAAQSVRIESCTS
jgi:hypothetical protein